MILVFSIAPTIFYSRIGGNLSGLKKLSFSHAIRRLMSRNVDHIRCRGIKRRSTGKISSQSNS